MATADEYAAWIVKNQGKKGTSDFETVAKAYQEAKLSEAAPARANVQAEPEPAWYSPKSVAQTVGNLGAGAIRGAGSIGATIIRPFETAEENAARRQAIDQFFAERGAEPESMAYGAGKLATEIVGTLPIGGIIAAPVKAIGRAIPAIADYAAPVAKALETGGFTSGLKTQGVPLSTKLGSIGARLVGGAATGGATALAIEPTVNEAQTGAATGADQTGVSGSPSTNQFKQWNNADSTLLRI